MQQIYSENFLQEDIASGPVLQQKDLKEHEEHESPSTTTKSQGYLLLPTHPPQQVMLLGVITGEGKKMPPIFFKSSKTCNAMKYHTFLR